MEVGRELAEMLQRLVEATERGAKANEELIVLAKEERVVDAGVIAPAFCPHCAEINPVVRNEGGRGNIDEFILAAACEKCGQRFYAIPNGWAVFSNPEAVRTELEARNQ